jgi:Holliday junction resolvasome RuvABC endonuclease subunit
MMNDRLWVGVDPGYGERNATGWAIVDDTFLLACGTLRVQGHDDDLRLLALAEQLRGALDRNIPIGRVWSCGCELPIFGPNLRVIATLARINGLVTGYCAEHGVRIYSIQPSAAKQALSGNGAADKAEMIRAAQQQFPQYVRVTHDAEADAIGIALAARACWLAQGGEG